jgi:hypothetical protein
MGGGKGKGNVKDKINDNGKMFRMKKKRTNK